MKLLEAGFGTSDKRPLIRPTVFKLFERIVADRCTSLSTCLKDSVYWQQVYWRFIGGLFATTLTARVVRYVHPSKNWHSFLFVPLREMSLVVEIKQWGHCRVTDIWPKYSSFTATWKMRWGAMRRTKGSHPFGPNRNNSDDEIKSYRKQVSRRSKGVCVSAWISVIKEIHLVYLVFP